jgi:hypothetical protein
LLQSVIERRLLPLNRIRQEKIEAVLAKAQNNSSLPDAEALLRAFIEPTLEFRNSSQGARDFISLIGRSLSEPDETVRNCFIDLALPILLVLFEALHQALPQLSPAILMTRLQFIMGTMSHVMCMSNRSTLLGSKLPPLDYNTLVEQLMKFVLAGLEAPE